MYAVDNDTLFFQLFTYDGSGVGNNNVEHNTLKIISYCFMQRHISATGSLITQYRMMEMVSLTYMLTKSK